MGRLVEEEGRRTAMLEATLRIGERQWQRALAVQIDGDELLFWGPTAKGLHTLGSFTTADLSWLGAEDASFDVGNGRLEVQAAEFRFLASLLEDLAVPRRPLGPRGRPSALAERVLTRAHVACA